MSNYYNDQWRLPNNENKAKQSNYSMNFDGSSSVINLGNTDAVKLGAGDFTFSAWINPDSWGSGYEGIYANNSTNGVYIGKDNAGNFVLRIVNVSNVISHSTLPTANTWTHICITRLNGNCTLYYNGSSVATGSSTQNFNANTNVYVGGDPGTGPSTSALMNGKLDAVSIYNYALSSSQITTLYGSSSTGIGNPMSLSPAPVAYYPLGDQDAFNGADYLVPNSSLKDYVFDFSSSQEINCGNDSSVQLGTVFTMACWINTTSTSRGSIFGTYISNGYYIDLMASGTVQGGYHSTGSHFLRPSSSTINDGNWHHICYVISGTATDGSDLNVYVDGQLNNGSFTSSGTPSGAVTTNPFKINLQGYAGRYTGKTSNVQIFNTALPATGSNSIETLYNNGSPLTSMSGFTSLQGWWKLDASATYDGSNWTIEDSSSNSNDGTSSGMTQANLVQSDLSFTTGYSPYALDFDGANDIIDCGSDSSLTPTTAFSVSCWVYLNATGTQTILHNGSGFSDGYFLYFTGSGLTFYIREGGSWRSLNSNDSFIANTWYNVTATWGGSTMKMYINNILQSNTATAASINISTRFRIGAYNGTAILNGRLSNVSVWNAALTQAQVSEIYNEAVPSNLNNHSAYSNLVSWWQLGSNTSWVDPYWIALDEKGTNNGESQNVAAPNNMGENAIVDGVGSYANGVSSGMSDAIVGDAPYSSSNSLSVNMDVEDRTTDTPS